MLRLTLNEPVALTLKFKNEAPRPLVFASNHHPLGAGYWNIPFSVRYFRIKNVRLSIYVYAHKKRCK